MSECPYCQNTFEMNETCADEFTMWQGLVGPYYYPYIDINGYLTWSNTGDLPNPDPVNIIGPPGHGVDIKGIVATYSDLPPSPNNGDVYLVGTEAPYDAYVYFEGVWTDIGDVSKGADGRGISSISKTGTSGNVDEYTITYTDASTPTIYYVTNGVGVPSGGTTGQVLAKASGTDYDTEWVDQSGGGGTVQSVNNVTPDQTGNITLTADDIGTDATNISIQDALDDYVYVGASAPTDPTTKIWLDTDEPGMSGVSSVNGATGTVVLDADDVGAMSEWVLLWENASPTSNFASQTISLSLSDYDYALIVFRFSTGYDWQIGERIIKVGSGFRQEFHDGNNALIARTGSVLSNGVSFDNAAYGGTNNSVCLPLRIYGIKGVQT